MIVQILPFLQKPGYVFDEFALRMKSCHLFLKFHVNLAILEYSFTKGKGQEIYKYYGGSEKSSWKGQRHYIILLLCCKAIYKAWSSIVKENYSNSQIDQDEHVPTLSTHRVSLKGALHSKQTLTRHCLHLSTPTFLFPVTQRCHTEDCSMLDTLLVLTLPYFNLAIR